MVYRIVYTKNSGGWGNLVILKHKTADGKVFYSGYALLKSIAVKENASVKAGDKVGVIGTTGTSTGVHLHLLVFSGAFSKSKLPAGYVFKKFTSVTYTTGSLTYYDSLKVISSKGSIIK